MYRIRKNLNQNTLYVQYLLHLKSSTHAYSSNIYENPQHFYKVTSIFSLREKKFLIKDDFTILARRLLENSIVQYIFMAYIQTISCLESSVLGSHCSMKYLIKRRIGDRL